MGFFNRHTYITLTNFINVMKSLRYSMMKPAVYICLYSEIERKKNHMINYIKVQLINISDIFSVE